MECDRYEKAYRDALTGLPNAVALEEQLAIHEAKRRCDGS